MGTTRKRHLTAMAAVLAVLVVPACSRAVDGRSIASTATTSSSSTTTTTRTTVAPTTTTALSIDEIVANAVRDTQTYWEVLGDVDTEFRVEEVSGALPCNNKIHRNAVMLYCDGVPGDNALRWNRALTQTFYNQAGEEGVRIVVSHEVAHAAQDADGRDYPSRAAKEASADCGAGAFTAYTGADKSAVDATLASLPEWSTDRQPHFDYGWGNLVDPAACLDYNG
ncbi:hypothetical protein [Mycolicibacterium fallax]|uniref:Uncharacterized protein n=1 Tax=Mycolicibacterium fallax TaxID=1793 RepID=A0A1X1R7S9_MYCFA|nr:hypothetical protein [Mycolicibacterium fallax]ORV00962.1 hypothetical protein AWC04_14920 [Mycolicibacterium fallax]BBZ00516.1 hypothetical protein MFAL_39820 [Mycolicibacterium fallax]